jgi:transcriptional regulator with XRE-family HTH domain
MSTESKLPCLPEDTTDQLVALKDDNTEQFYALVKALRLEGWPLRAIAEPFGVSRTAVQGWEAKYTEDTPLPSAPELPIQPRKKRTRNSKPKKELGPDQIEDLRALTIEASKVRRYTDRNSSSRRAASELEAKLLEYSDRGISRIKLAEYCGVSDSAIKQRLRKHSNGV